MDAALARRRVNPAPTPADRISALPDDMLILIVARLGCPRAAARTGVLSRRWSALDLARIPRVTVSLHDVELQSLGGALAGAACAGVHLVDVRVPASDCEWGDRAAVSDAVNSALLAASRLAPVEFRFTNSFDVDIEAQLPCFRRATSIELQAEPEPEQPSDLYINLPPLTVPGGEFTALDRLSVSRCVVNLAALIPRCPRLRVLSALVLWSEDITIHSASLEEIAVENQSGEVTNRIDIVCPALKQLTLCVETELPDVSLAVPLLEKVSWQCRYIPDMRGKPGTSCLWELDKLGIESPRSHGGQGTLSVAVSADFMPMLVRECSFAQEIAKLPVSDFSILHIQVRFNTTVHEYGPVVLHLLGIAHISAATRKLKVDIGRWFEEKEVCPENCPCGEPNKWTTQEATYLGDLQEVEIVGLQGMDHEFDFIKRLLRCAPLLKRMAVKFFDKLAPSDSGYKKIHTIFTEYPLVDCYVCSNSGLKPGIQRRIRFI